MTGPAGVPWTRERGGDHLIRIGVRETLANQRTPDGVAPATGGCYLYECSPLGLETRS